MRLVFDDSQAVLEVPDCEIFLAALKAAAGGWPFRAVAFDGDPMATVEKRGARYVIRMPGEDDVEATAVGTACSVLADVAMAAADKQPSHLCLHCGSVLVNGRLIAMPSRSHAGKSTLVARLAADGHMVFGDDMLTLSEDDRRGVAMGVAPRLRLPLPESASAPFRAFVEDNASARDHRYLCLSLPNGGLAARNVEAPLGAILLLDRRSGAKASLGLAPQNAVLQTLIRQNVTRGPEAADVLERAAALAARLPSLMLTYGDLDEAAALIAETFQGWPPRLEGVGQGEAYVLSVEEAKAFEEEVDPLAVQTRAYPREQQLRRTAEVALKSVGGDLFLAGGPEGSIVQMNEIGAGLWNLLAQTTSEAEAAEILSGAFPERNAREIEASVAEMFAALAGAGLIEPADCN